jgi:hypothetical protein
MLYMFDHLEEGDRVKGVPGQGEIFEQSLMNPKTRRACGLCGQRCGFDPFGSKSHAIGNGQTKTCGTTHVQQADLMIRFVQHSGDVEEAFPAAIETSFG